MCGGWVEGEVEVCYSIPLKCVVLVCGGGVCACVSEWVWVWVGGKVGVCYSTPLNCAVFVTEDVQVFSPHSEH